MERVIYEIVRHNDGWAYRVGSVFSETFPTREEAIAAAEQAASEHAVAGSDEHIEYEDAEGVWHEEDAPGDERPETVVITPSEPGEK